MASQATQSESDAQLPAALENHAADLAGQAGALLLDYFNRPLETTYKSKGHGDPVTDADKAAHELLVKGIQARFPEHGVLSEEGAGTPPAGATPYLWVIDPLDGTTNYLNRFPLWGVSIGVLRNGVPVAAALYLPALASLGSPLLHARAGGGSHIGDAPLALAFGAETSDRRLTTMPAYFRGQFRMSKTLRRNIGEVRNTGSIACELALAATGSLQLAAFGSPKIWDVAAGALIVNEAGGRVMVRTRRSRWKPFESFLDPGAGLPRDGNLAKWGAGLLAGAPAAVDAAASGLRPRLGLVRWFRRLLDRR
ncbi:MAG: inositol monophosphatase family protein [Chloroflexi bacterium]|nr:inositol monophosphatase family protein [Chloroflexota bacterium]